jgi:hypothetical protein
MPPWGYGNCRLLWEFPRLRAGYCLSSEAAGIWLLCSSRPLYPSSQTEVINRTRSILAAPAMIARKKPVPGLVALDPIGELQGTDVVVAPDKGSVEPVV